jgi:hypothetical protein
MDTYDVASAALAGSVLYALYALSDKDDNPHIDTEQHVSYAEDVRDLRTGGIPTHLLNRDSKYISERHRVGPESSVDFRSPFEIYKYAAMQRRTKTEVFADEVFNENRISFYIPRPTAAITRIHTVSGSYPGISNDYVFRGAQGIRPKIGGLEDPY